MSDASTEAERIVTLHKHLSLSHAVALAIGMVVGAGYLAIPGAAYSMSGGAALYAWLANGVIIIPLLIVFAHIGASHPSASGLAGYFGLAFGPIMQAGIEVLVLTSFMIAMPAIALAGGAYGAYLLDAGASAQWMIALLFFFTSALVNIQGVALSAQVQQALSYTLLAALFVIAAACLLFGRHGSFGVAPASSALQAIPSLGTVFFAFIGWEMLSFTTAEFKNAKRDFPLALGFSYLLVMALYVAVALALQANLPRSDPALLSAPLSRLIAVVFGARSSALVSVLAVIIVGANVNGATLAVSRLVYACAQTGLLPRRLGALDTVSRAPRDAIILVGALFAAIACAVQLGWIDPVTLFRLSGKSFLIVYALCTAAFVRMATTPAAKTLGWTTLALCFSVTLFYGADLLFPVAIFCLGMTIGKLREWRPHVAG